MNWIDGTSALSLLFLETLYADYLEDPMSVPEDFRAHFKALASEDCFARHPRRALSLRLPLPPSTNGQGEEAVNEQGDLSVLQERVDQLVHAYRVRGHLSAHIDPLGLRRTVVPELEPAFHQLSVNDLDRPVSSTTMFGAPVRSTREILARVRNTYCRSIGVQFMHIDDLRVRRWLEERMERTENHIVLDFATQRWILTRLTEAAILEEFIQKKYLGAKSFSLEGAETLVPLLDLVIERAGEQGIDEIVLGMGHRGRLNVLVNVMGKSLSDVFTEFEDRPPQDFEGRGDVKYHLGYSRDWTTRIGRPVHLSLCFNPSHLEFVGPVALGRIRAKQDRVGDADGRRGMALLVHGDAAFAGEGITQETLNMSELAAYKVGGTLHVVVNNQIGFTTPPEESRSGVYASDAAKMLQIPIFHVNGEDPEAVAQVVALAMEFRAEFQRDVVIDLLCYRRRGHNETDEPAFTQPLLYARIRNRSSVRDTYLDHLLALGGVSREEADAIADDCRNRLDEAFEAAQGRETFALPSSMKGVWEGYRGGRETDAAQVETGVPVARLSVLLEALTRLPADFHPHPKIRKGLDVRLEQARGNQPLDWSAAEALAFATLATDGVRVRLSGQDSARGTFSHRHFALHDVEDGHRYCPLQHVAAEQAPVDVWNSPLAELGPLGFEYGYSLDCPDGLVIWEAQFGDFVNAAQVMVDQFLTSAEEKWRRLSGLVLLLPHGLEGMGPEHSSARLERFLGLAAEDNIQVTYPTTAAQFFHLLRRQVLRKWRKPLVVLTPKSLLRNPATGSSLTDCASDHFRPILADPIEQPAHATAVLLCSGKVYFDLAKARHERRRQDVGLLRLEQLYPLPDGLLEEALAPYPRETAAIYVQEEPENMGAWPYLKMRFGSRLPDGRAFQGVARRPSASPGTGSAASHRHEQRLLVERAFAAADDRARSRQSVGADSGRR